LIIGLNDGRNFNAAILGVDLETDLAFLKVEANDLPTIEFASVTELAIGDMVLAVGNPYGLGVSVSMGIISALGRSQLGINVFENFIQTDAAINPGYSGGALVDLRGRLIGVNSAIYSDNGGSVGIGFAIPVSTVSQVLDEILRSGSVSRGWIGVDVLKLPPDAFKQLNGVKVTRVFTDSPAAKAGIKPGDIISRIDELPIATTGQLVAQIAAYRPGTSMLIDVRNKHVSRVLSITPQSRPRQSIDHEPCKTCT
jgi:S1-C subfamily serine protease